MKPLKKLIFSLLLVGLCLGSIEGVIRLLLPDLQPKPLIPLGIGQHDPDLGWAPKPGAFGTSDRFGVSVDYRVNSRGLRGPEIPYERIPGFFRILLLGDSQTYGYGVPIEKHFSHLLPKYLQKVEVVNLGVSGYGIDQELLFYRKEGHRYQPDLVISFVPHYKAHRHMYPKRWLKEKPHFILKNGELDLQNTPIPKKATMPLMVKTTHNWLYMNSVAYRTRHYLWQRLLVRFRKDPNDVEYDAYIQNSQDPKFMTNLHELGAAIIRATADDVTQQGSAYIVVSPMPELLATAKELGILSLDTSQSLNNSAFELPDYHSHINEAGNGVLAWELAKFLKAHDLVPREHW